MKNILMKIILCACLSLFLTSKQTWASTPIIPYTLEEMRRFEDHFKVKKGVITWESSVINRLEPEKIPRGYNYYTAPNYTLQEFLKQAAKNESVTDIYLQHSFYNEKEWGIFKTFFKKTKSIKELEVTITHHDLENFKITDQNIATIIKESSYLTSIDINNLDFQPHQILEALSKKSKILKIGISYNPHISLNYKRFMGENLIDGWDYFQNQVDYFQNQVRIFKNQWKSLKEGGEKIFSIGNDRPLVKLHFDNATFNNNSVMGFLQLIQKHQSLTDLSLMYNHMTEARFGIFFHTLKECPLKKLRLSNSIHLKEAISSLTSFIRTTRTLTDLNISYYYGALADGTKINLWRILSALSKNTTLVKVKMTGYTFKREDGTFLRDSWPEKLLKKARQIVGDSDQLRLYTQTYKRDEDPVLLKLSKRNKTLYQSKTGTSTSSQLIFKE